MAHKAGFVNIIGSPNVGKSTLLNALTGENLAIITPKAQTTRHRIIGIVNEEDYQIVFSDTPGLIEPKYRLQESMMSFIDTAMEDADIFLLVIEAAEGFPFDAIIEKLNRKDTPLIVVVNKIDLLDQEKVVLALEKWKQVFPTAMLLPISALHKFNIDDLKSLILDYLPESPPYYPKDELTDRHLRFFVSEIIREKILLIYKQEIPYSVEVVIEEFKEQEDITHIRATVYASRDSQKAIIIGKGGKAIKRLGTDSRKSIEAFLRTRVFLDLQVKVSKEWRNDPKMLKWFGYSQQ